MRVTALELPARWAEPTAALADVDDLLARGPATELGVLPEASLSGYVSPQGDFDLAGVAEPVDGSTAQALAALAVRHRVHLVGPLIEAAPGGPFNAMIGFAPDGTRVLHYRKRHPWMPETWASPGDLPHPRVRIGALTVTIAICYDLHFLPDEAADVLATTDLLLFPSAWVDRRNTRPTRLRALAARFGIAVVNANWGCGDVCLPGQDGSCIVAADGQLVAVAGPKDRRVDATL
jgi:predicted amidohydrolase